MSSADTVILSDRYQRSRSAAAAFVADLEDTLAGDGVDLPSLPRVALSIRSALAEPNADIGQITTLIGSDPAIAARLLKVANCALFNPGSKPVADLRTAVMRLGLRTVRNLTLSIAAQQVFLGYGTKEIAPYIDEVWQHSIHTAAMAHLVALQSRTVAEDEAFLAGLLHEIGKLYILMRARDHLDLFRDAHAFRSVLGDCQARVGAAIMEAWEFPAELVDAVAGHEQRSLDCAEPVTLADVVAVANYLTESLADATDGNTLLENIPSFGALDLDQDTIVWMISASATDAQYLQEALAS